MSDCGCNYLLDIMCPKHQEDMLVKVSDPKPPQTFEEHFESRYPLRIYQNSVFTRADVERISRYFWNAAQAALRNQLRPNVEAVAAYDAGVMDGRADGRAEMEQPCSDCQHPMGVHDNQVDPIPTHGCLVCAEKVRVRLAMEQEKAAAVVVAEEAVAQQIESWMVHDGISLQRAVARIEEKSGGALARALDQARDEAIREGERREAAAEAREKALRERLDTVEQALRANPDSIAAPVKTLIADQLRAILEGTK